MRLLKDVEMKLQRADLGTGDSLLRFSVVPSHSSQLISFMKFEGF